MSRLPVIDMAPLAETDPARRQAVAVGIAAACARDGFFYVVGHGIRPETMTNLEAASRAFFALPTQEKARIAMRHGGRAWRGWFPLGDELTSGRPDEKEGLYFGEELGPDDARVAAGWPLHGANLWPEAVPTLRPAVETFIKEATKAARLMAEGISLALGLPADYLAAHYTRRPTVLFRIFRYPPEAQADEERFGVGEHTDYGFLTLLAQDQYGGLEVRTPGGWVDAPPIPGALVCNIGDMLDRLSGGRLRSTPHRVRNRSGCERLSFPLFFDPAFDAVVKPLPGSDPDPEIDRASRWDDESVHAGEGTYGAYLLRKVGRVFPTLKAAALGPV